MEILANDLPFKLQSVPSAMYVFVRKWVKWADIPTFFDDNLELIAQAMTDANTPPQYFPSIFIHKVDEQSRSSELSVAIETQKPLPILGGGTIQFPAGQALIAQHIGSIGQTDAIHQAMSAYVAQNDLTVGIAIEEYRDSKTTEMGDEQSETWIIYRLYDGINIPRILC